jgi:hypothetical protein
MRHSTRPFELIGHVCLGDYPGPAVPIGNQGSRRVGSYRAPDGVSVIFKPIDPSLPFAELTPELRRSLTGFDVEREALFAFGRADVTSYKIAEEPTFFLDLLRRPSGDKWAIEDPFFRLSLAEVTANEELILGELVRCTQTLSKESPPFLNDWYRQTVAGLDSQGLLPKDWPLDPSELLTRAN